MKDYGMAGIGMYHINMENNEMRGQFARMVAELLYLWCRVFDIQLSKQPHLNWIWESYNNICPILFFSFAHDFSFKRLFLISAFDIINPPFWLVRATWSILTLTMTLNERRRKTRQFFMIHWFAINIFMMILITFPRYWSSSPRARGEEKILLKSKRRSSRRQVVPINPHIYSHCNPPTLLLVAVTHHHCPRCHHHRRHRGHLLT